MKIKNLYLIVILVLIMSICFAACSSENNITSIKSSSFESTSTLSENENNMASLQITTSSQNESSSKTSKPTTSTSSPTSSSTSSKKLKVLKPKTKRESVLTWHEDYDLIERFPAERVTDMSRTELLTVVEDNYGIKLPKSTIFEPKGTIEFIYEVLGKYEYKYRTFGIKINNLITYYTKSEVEGVLKQAQEHEGLGIGLDYMVEEFLYEHRQEMEKIVGDLSNQEYYQFDLYTEPYEASTISRRKYIFIMKEAENRYMVVFSGETTNYDLYNGTLEVQPDGSAKAIG